MSLQAEQDLEKEQEEEQEETGRDLLSLQDLAEMKLRFP